MNKEVESLIGWLEDGEDYEEIDATLEWLGDSEMLNNKGKKFAHNFWHWYWHEVRKM